MDKHAQWDGEVIEARNSVAWKLGDDYPNAWGMAQTGSPTRPMYCGGLGQRIGGPGDFKTPVHDEISAPDALQRAKSAGFATRLRKGSKVTLQNFITANHGGVAALWYSCPACSVDTPEEYLALNWTIMTPIKDSYPEAKWNGVGFSDKMPEWYGFGGAICSRFANYVGGIHTCDDCQLKYGGPNTTATWRAELPPNGADIAAGQRALIVEIEYQLPADFECPNAVFSWMWRTPHFCVPKEVVEKRAENDFWKFCGKNIQGEFPVCTSEWQDEIFNNCMDAEVVDFYPTPAPPPTPPPPPPAPTPQPTTAPPAPGPGPCRHQTDCSISAWCNDSSYVGWCSQNGAGGNCPAPHCTTDPAALASSGSSLSAMFRRQLRSKWQSPPDSSLKTVTKHEQE